MSAFKRSATVSTEHLESEVRAMTQPSSLDQNALKLQGLSQLFSLEKNPKSLILQSLSVGQPVCPTLLAPSIPPSLGVTSTSGLDLSIPSLRNSYSGLSQALSLDHAKPI